MYAHHIAYRHGDGQVEGFVGFGFTQAGAERNAIQRIQNKVEFTPKTFDSGRVIRAPEALVPGELDVVRRDWAAEEKRDS